MQKFLSFLALVVAVGVGAVLYTQNNALRERVDTLEAARLTADEEPAGPADGSTPALTGSRTAREVAELRRMTNALVQRVDENASRVALVTEGGGAGGASDGPAPGSPSFTEAVREVVLDMAANDVAFRSKVGTAERTHLGKDPPFAKLASALQLDASQESQMSKDLQEMQQELFGLLQEERDDGVKPLEIIAKAEALQDKDPKRAQLFMELFGLHIPGSDETYMQRFVKLQTGFRKKVVTYLRPAQVEIWHNLDVDLFDVKFD